MITSFGSDAAVAMIVPVASDPADVSVGIGTVNVASGSDVITGNPPVMALTVARGARRICCAVGAKPWMPPRSPG